MTENKALTELVPDKRGAIVKIILNDDEHFVCKIDNPKGEPENPLSDDEIKKKARELLCFAGLNSSIAVIL